jgi:RimJ/RimL family protein N-acetyltransferase
MINQEVIQAMFKGQRVLLRATTRDDMKRQWEFENDAEIWFWDGGTPQPAPLEMLLAHFDEQKAGNRNSVSFAIEADNRYIGHCSLHSFDDTARHCELSIEIGDREYQGKGYGREVIKLLLDYAFEHRNLERVWLATHSENERAIRCYRACGFVEEGRLRRHLFLRGHFVDRIFMGILKEDYVSIKD